MIISILGEDWNIEIVSDEKHFNLHIAEGDHATEALTDPDKNSIYFKKSKFTLHNVRHELVHAYIAMCCASHDDLDKNSFEEIMCDIVGKYGAKLIEQAECIFNALKENK